MSYIYIYIYICVGVGRISDSACECLKKASASSIKQVEIPTSCPFLIAHSSSCKLQAISCRQLGLSLSLHIYIYIYDIYIYIVIEKLWLCLLKSDVKFDMLLETTDV